MIGVDEKAYGLVFEPESARGMRDGSKTVTRRVLTPGTTRIDGHKLRNVYGMPVRDWWALLDFEVARVDGGPSPAGNAGPYLHVPYLPEETVHRIYPDHPMVAEAFYVKEPWFFYVDGDGCDQFPLRSLCHADYCVCWKSPRFMPRRAARDFYRVTRVRIERLWDISEADALEEGVEVTEMELLKMTYVTPLDAFRSKWDQLNGKRAPWASNPWVIVRDFEPASGC